MRVWLRLIELLVLYVGLPLLFYFKYIPMDKLLTLSIVFVYCTLVLFINHRVRLRDFGFRGFRGWVPILVRIVAATAIILILTYVIIPKYLFALPLQRPWFWLAILLMYPFWSVIPQELIYRSFFFERYKVIFRNDKVIAIASATLFAFLHIVFHNWVAVAGTFVIGLFWSFAYLRHRSFAAVTLEHSIVGIILFTVGLGIFFV